MNVRAACVAMAGALVSGCAWFSGSSSLAPSDSVYCTEFETEVPADDETLGFSAEELLTIVIGTHTAPFRYFHDPSEPELVLVVDRSPEPVFLRNFEPPVGEICPIPTLRFSMDVSLVTSDGAIDESWRQTVEMQQWVPQAGLDLVRDTAELQGNLDLSGMDRLTIWGTVFEGEDGEVAMHGVVTGEDFAGSDTGSGVVAGACIGLWNLPDDTPCEE